MRIWNATLAGPEFRIKSRQLEGLAIGESADADGSFSWAVFGGLGTFDGVEGHQFLVYAEDRDASGTADRFWLEVRDPGGALVPELSMALLAPPNAVALQGGSIQVH